MHRLITESLLGLQCRGDRLCMRPLLPAHWKAFDMQYSFGASRYDISCRRVEAEAATSIVHDGIEADGDAITLVDDAQVHVVIVNLPRRR